MLFILACGEVEDAPELEAVANFTDVDIEEIAEENVTEDNATEELVTINTTEAEEYEQKKEELKVRGRNFTKLPPNIREFTVQTSDSILLYGTQYKRETDKTIIMIHMLGRDRSTWDRLAKELQNIYNVLAIDLRGHGRSQLSWRDFDETDFNNIVLDIKGSKEALKTTNFVVIGASIGANAALNFAVDDEDVKGLILLSPGLDYRGVKTEDSITKVEIPLLIAATKEDTYAAESSQTLADKASNAKLLMYDGDEHGTHMLRKYDLEDEIFAFLEDVFTSTES